ncbi:MAG: 30S ribosomal protein S5 [Candidatus Saccharimonadales bacterium]
MPGQNDTRPRRSDKPAEAKEFDERTLAISRVARVVKGGRRFRFRALVVVGDKKGRVGVGIAKGADVTAAVTKANGVAKNQLITVKLYKDTLPHEAQAKVSGALVLVKPASSGTGLIAGGVVRTILEVAGVKNALSKSLGSTNKTNIAYATISALESIVPANKWVSSAGQLQPKPEKTEKPAETAKPKTAKKPATKTATKSPASQAAKKTKS